jgi:hypothetical protein
MRACLVMAQLLAFASPLYKTLPKDLKFHNFVQQLQQNDHPDFETACNLNNLMTKGGRK